MRDRTPAIPPPVVGVIVPDPHPYGHIERARLAVPTVVRHARTLRWQDEPEDIRNEVKEAAIHQLTFRLMTAKRVKACNPGLEGSDELIDKLERALEAAERL